MQKKKLFPRSGLAAWKVLAAAVLTGSVFTLAGCDNLNMSQLEEKKVMGSQVVVVDVQKVFRESAVADRAREHLEKVRFSLQKGLEAIEDVYGAKGSHPSAQMLQEGAQRLELQYKAEEQAVNQVVAQVLATTAQAWSDEHPDKVVIARNLVLGAGGDADITADILEKMKTVTPAFAEVPTVTVKKPEVQKPAEKSTRKKEAEKPVKKTTKETKTDTPAVH